MKHSPGAKIITVFIIFLGTMLFASFGPHPSFAGEKEIKTTGGASLGKWRYNEVDASDALLEVDLAGRTLISVSAGYIGNEIYQEFWRFNDSVLSYQKLPSGHYYYQADHNEKDAPRLICGREVKKECDIIKSDKLSKNLIIVTYRRRQNGAACAGLIYVGEEILGEGFDTYGDYYARSISCVPASRGTDEALALSAHYLSLVKKDGRRIANLKRYDFPKPRSLVSRQSGTSAVSRAPNTSEFTRKNNCHLATTPYLKWEEGEKYREDVKKAKELGLKQDCRVQLGLHYVRPAQKR